MSWLVVANRWWRTGGGRTSSGIREARPDVVVGLPEVAASLDGRGGHDAAPATRLQRATSRSSSEYTRNCSGARTDDLVVDRADGRLSLGIHGREGVDDRHPDAVVVMQRVADAGLCQAERRGRLAAVSVLTLRDSSTSAVSSPAGRYPSAAVCASAPTADRWRTTRSDTSCGNQLDAVPEHGRGRDCRGPGVARPGIRPGRALVVRHVTIFGYGHGLQRAIIDESQHRKPECLIMAQH